MTTPALAVYHWPADAAQVLQALQHGKPVVLWLQHSARLTDVSPPMEARSAARTAVRSLAQEVVAAFLGRQPQQITLSDQRGSALKLQPAHSLQLSVSHEAGASVLAIHAHQPIGVDIVRCLQSYTGPDEIARLARDYLGPQQAAYIAQQTPLLQLQPFAQAWAAHEAGLKCLHEALTEWTPALAQRLQGCSVRVLSLPGEVVAHGLYGAVAYGSGQPTPNF